jgi:hypothetical protein
LLRNLHVHVLYVVDDDAGLLVLNGLREGRGSSHAGCRVGDHGGGYSCGVGSGRVGILGSRARARHGGLGSRCSASRRGGRDSGRDESRAGRAGGSRAERSSAGDLRNDPRGGLVGVELEVVEVISNNVSSGANWVSACAVVAENGSVAVEEREVCGTARVGLLVGAIEDVVGLVGSVHDVAPEESGSDGLAGGRGVVDTGGDLGATTRSTENVADNVSTLRVAVDYDVGARALLVESGDLSDTVACTLSDLSAVVGSESDIVLDLDVVAGLALGSQLGAGGIAERRCATIVVRGIIAASHEDDYIGTSCVELGSSGLGGSEGRESANGEGLTDERHIKY